MITWTKKYRRSTNFNKVSALAKLIRGKHFHRNRGNIFVTRPRLGPIWLRLEKKKKKKKKDITSPPGAKMLKATCNPYDERSVQNFHFWGYFR